jgi:hypothetical protein
MGVKTMKKTRKLLAIILASVIILSMFGINTLFGNNVLAKKPTPSPTPSPTPTTTTMSFSPAAFSDDVGYGTTLYGNVFACAPIQLPQGAQITKIGFSVLDPVPGNVQYASEISLVIWKVNPLGQSLGVGFGHVYSSDSNSVIYISNSVPPMSDYNPVNNKDGA